MRRLGRLLIILILAVPAVAQYPEVDALREAFFATDLATVARHLPPALAKAISDLTALERAALEKDFLVAEKLKREGITVTPVSGAEVLATIEPGPEGKLDPVEVLLEKRLSDGGESVLRLRARSKSGRTGVAGVITVWMKYLEGEWRVYELQSPDGEKINLDDSEFLDRIKSSGLNANEASAVGSLRTLNTAAVTYASTYPEIGFPPGLDVLGVAEEAEPSSSHSGLVDSSLSTPPYERSGYRFIYRPHGGQTPIVEYTIVALPIDFGVSGQRSFFTDQSGVIRFTEEEREPTVQDKPLQ